MHHKRRLCKEVIRRRRNGVITLDGGDVCRTTLRRRSTTSHGDVFTTTLRRRTTRRRATSYTLQRRAHCANGRLTTPSPRRATSIARLPEQFLGRYSRSCDNNQISVCNVTGVKPTLSPTTEYQTVSTGKLLQMSDAVA